MSAYELTKTILKDSANLKAYYRMEAGALTTDSSGNANTLTNNNTVADGTGVYGGGADYSASNTNKRLSLSSVFGIATGANFSMSGWFKLNAEIASGTWQLMHIVFPRIIVGFAYFYNGGTRRIGLQTYNGTDTSAYYNITLGTSNFYHFCLTRSGNVYYLYLNGAMVATATKADAGVDTYTAGFNIGADSTPANFSSVIADDCAVYSTALSADQIKELYEGRYIGEWMPSSDTKAIYHLSSETDCSGNNFHLTNVGGTFGMGGINKRITFVRASGQYAWVNSSLVGVSPSSIAMYAKISVSSHPSAGQIRGIAGERRNTNGGNRFYLLHQADGSGNEQIAFGIDLSGGGATITKTIPLTLNKEYLVCAVWDGSANKIQLYIDGVQATTEVSVSGTLLGTVDRFVIGCYYTVDPVTYGFDGSIDEVAIFSRALTAAEIRHWFSWSVGKYL